MKLSIEELKKYSLAANREVASMADELILFRELKGDQVPVGVYNQHLFNLEGSAVLLSINKAVESGFVSESGNLTRNHAYLFTAPQKPVVLPVRVTGQDMRETFNYLMSQEEADSAANGFNQCLIESKAAIESAGGIVKDGE